MKYILICIVIFASVIVSFYAYGESVIIPQQEANQLKIDEQTQTIENQLQNNGYIINEAKFNSPSITVIVTSLEEFEQKAQQINTTQIYKMPYRVNTGPFAHTSGGQRYYVIDGQVAWEYTPDYSIGGN